MKDLSKITILTILISFVMICSFIVSFGALGTSQSLYGVSMEYQENWKISFDNISTLAISDDTVLVTRNPSVSGNTINYALQFKQVGGYSQFQFEIRNDGNVAAKVKKIEVLGLEEYDENVSVSFVNLNEGDIIESDGILSNIKVITKYDNQYYNEESEIDYVTLNNIEINIEFE